MIREEDRKRHWNYVPKEKDSNPKIEHKLERLRSSFEKRYFKHFNEKNLHPTTKDCENFFFQIYKESEESFWF